VFNGDADGLCALQQLRLTTPGEGTLVTGVKRDIELLARVKAAPGDEITVLDVSLDVNRAGLVAVLEAGAKVVYFDHHHAGEIPASAALETHLDMAPNVCTSLLVDRFLNGQQRLWAIVGTFGDSLTDEGNALATAAGLHSDDAKLLKELGVSINYNAYGETLADLHVPPADLAKEMQTFADPREFARRSPTFKRLFDGYRKDMDLAARLAPTKQAPGSVMFVLPDEAWARRASGTLANDLAKAHAGNAIAIVSPKAQGGYLVSVRVPKESNVSAEAFCRRFPTGGGRKTAAGINHLPAPELEAFASDFAEQFAAGSA
jgi:single-stranded DNA-specific DHH superfamily exonuclease